MFEVLKYGQDKKGYYWVVGHLNHDIVDFFEIFNTNLKSEEILKTGKAIPVKKFKISKDKNGKYHYYLEF